MNSQGGKFGQICVEFGSTLPAPRPRPSSFTASTVAPAARSRSTKASQPRIAATCNGVLPRALEERCLLEDAFCCEARCWKLVKEKVRRALQI